MSMSVPSGDTVRMKGDAAQGLRGSCTELWPVLYTGSSVHSRRPEREATTQAATTPKRPPAEPKVRAPLVPAACVALAELEPLALEFDGEVALPLAAELERVAVGAAWAVKVDTLREIR